MFSAWDVNSWFFIKGNDLYLLDIDHCAICLALQGDQYANSCGRR